MLKQIQQRYRLGKPVVVADAAMLSKDNLDALDQAKGGAPQSLDTKWDSLSFDPADCFGLWLRFYQRWFQVYMLFRRIGLCGDATRAPRAVLIRQAGSSSWRPALSFVPPACR